MAKKTIVYVPVSGVVTVTVDGHLSKEEAYEAACRKVDSGSVGEDYDFDWETHRKLVRGNVFCGMQREIDVEHVEEDGE